MSASYSPACARRWSISPGVTGPCSSIQRSSSRSVWARKCTFPESWSKPSAVRVFATGKRRTRTPSTSESPGG